jgi:uncharacterized protein YeaO (DUF488 family)
MKNKSYKLENNEYGKRRNHLFRPQSRHYSDLLDRVRDFILTTNKGWVTKEDVARMFKVKDYEVEQCFQKLNLEGLLSQGYNKPPHDSKRDLWLFGINGPRSNSNDDWSPTVYTIRRESKEDDFEMNEDGNYERKIKGKLYLSNISKSGWFGENVSKLFIARQPIKNMDKYKMEWPIELVPSYDLWYEFTHRKINWDDYYKRYRKEVILNPKCKDMLDKIMKRLKNGEDIMLICYCDKSKFCHRGILGEYFINEGVEVINLDEYDDSKIYSAYDILFDLPICEKYQEKILNELLFRKEYIFNILESSIIKLKPYQIRNLIDYTIKNNDEKIASSLVKNYESMIKTSVQDRLDSIVILHIKN